MSTRPKWTTRAPNITKTVMFLQTCLAPILGLGLLTALPATASPPPLPEPRLVKDIATGPATSDTNARDYTPIAISPSGSQVFFVHGSDDTGQELWTSDGTLESSRLVKDVRPGIVSSEVREPVMSGDRLFFTADNGLHGREIWVSDGTEAGTQRATDLPLRTGSRIAPHALHAFKGGVAFAAYDENGLLTLGWTDGTALNTRLLKPLVRGQDTDWTTNERRWAVLGSYLYFGTQDGPVTALWRTDGTETGTTRVKSFPGSDLDPVALGVVNDTLVFCAQSDGTGFKLWKTDGSEAGTALISDTGGLGIGEAADHFVVLGNTAYFPGPYNNPGLWQTDGTTAGTRKIRTTTSLLHEVVALGDQLLIATRGDGGGNPSQFGLLNPTTLQYQAVGSGTGNVSHLTSNGQQAWYAKYFPAGGQQYQLFTFDGQQETGFEQQNWSLFDIRATPSGVFFTALTGSQRNLWQASSQAVTAVRLDPAIRRISGSNPGQFVTAGGLQFFTASTRQTNEDLWVTDGTEAGTRRVRETGTPGVYPQSLVSGPDGIVYFSGFTPEEGQELWRSDGTAAGTWIVRDLVSGSTGSRPDDLAHYAGRIFFTASTESNKRIYTTRGAAGGADMLPLENVFRPSPGVSFDEDPFRFAVTQGSLYFFGRVPNTDGLILHRVTEVQGELQITRLGQAFEDPGPLLVDPASGGLYFTALDSYTHSQRYLYRTDGVTAPAQVPFQLPLIDPETVADVRFSGGLVVVQVDRSPNGEHLRVSDPATGQLTLLARGTLFGSTDEAIYFWTRNPLSPETVQINRIRADGSGRTVVAQLPGVPEQVLTRAGMLIFSTPIFPGVAQSERDLWITQGTPETTRRVPLLLSTSAWKATLKGDTLLLGGVRAVSEAGGGIGQELYALDLPAPSLALTRLMAGAPPLPLAEGATLSLTQAVGQSRSVTLQVTNTGLSTITDVTLTPPVPALPDFAFNLTSMGDLAPGQTAQVQITFTPASAGLQEGEFTVSASGIPGIELELSGTGLGGDFPPALGALPPVVLAAVGDSLTLKPEFIVPGESPAYLWRKTGKNAGKADSLTLSPVILTTAGSYTLSVTNADGTATTSPTAVAVLQPLPPLHRAAEGRSLVLTCATAGPKEGLFTYQWLRNGLPLSDNARLQGTATARLTLTGITAADNDLYTCLVTFTLDGQSVTRSTATEIQMVPKPVWVPSVALYEKAQLFLLGERIETGPLHLLYAAYRDVTVRGLPAGLTYDPASGSISGTPRKAGAFTLTLTAKNAAGTAVTTLTGRVSPALTPGSYDGLVDRVPEGDGETTPGLGSRVRLTVAAAGTASGQLSHDGRTYRFAGVPVPVQDERDSPLTAPASVVISRGKNQPSLTLTFKTGSTPVVTISDARTGTATTGILRRPVFSKNVPATAYVGPYNLILDSEETGPAGCGFLTATLAKTGVITWKGKLADGTVLTGSSAISARPSEQASLMAFALHHDLYKGTGSLHGWVEMPGLVTDPQPVMISGRLTWNKAPLPTASNYKDGIPVHEVGVFGGSYQAPGQDEYLMHLDGGPDNASMTIQADSIPVPQGLMTQSFTATLKHKAELPALSPGTFLKSLTFDVKRGTFKGSLVIPNADPKRVRTAAFEGIMDPVINNRAAGFFLLPDLPAEGPPATTLKSASIEITP